MSVNKRIKQLRQALNISQAKFGKRLSISNGYIAAIELETRNVNERIIKLVCQTFGVSEDWLKTGEGDMFDSPGDEKLSIAICLFKELRPEFQDYVISQLDELLELQSQFLP